MKTLFVPTFRARKQILQPLRSKWLMKELGFDARPVRVVFVNHMGVLSIGTACCLPASWALERDPWGYRLPRISIAWVSVEAAQPTPD
jgi:hypothetical protein